MTAEGVAEMASLLADGTRAAVCTTLLDGRAWTAGELARATGVAPSTMSEHLSRLIGGGLLLEHRQGRHRYVALAGSEVALAIEQLMVVAGPRPPVVRSFRAHSTAEALRRGRTCYDHLAGRLGVAVTDAMVRRGVLNADLGLAQEGHRWLVDEFGADLESTRRVVTRPCLDWTERRPHLGGALAARLCSEFFARGWIARVGVSRAVRITPDGEPAFERLFALAPE